MATRGEPAPPPKPRAPAESVGPATSHFAEVARPVTPVGELTPRRVPRGVVAFDLDGTILDSVGLISQLAGDALFKSFGTPPEEGRIHYLATTGMPFEAQLAQLYPEAPAHVRSSVARLFHQRKVQEAYARAEPFPEVPKLLRELDQAGWTLVVSTGAEREMAELILEREGLRFWFEAVLGSAQGTKREHLQEYRRIYPGVPIFLIGDSRFDMEASTSVPGIIAIGRASSLPGWSLTPKDLMRWGASWADYSLADLPEVLARLSRPGARGEPRSRTTSRPSKGGGRGRTRKGRDRDSPKTGDGPASV